MFQTVSSLYSNLGWIGKAYVVTHAPPCISWAAGAAEGVIRTAFHAVSTLFSAVTRDREQTEKHFAETKRACKLTVATTMLACVSVIPVVGAGYSYIHLIGECDKYGKMNGAIQRASQEVRQQRIETLFKVLKDNEITPEIISSAFSDVSAPVGNITKFLDRDRDIQGSLVRYYLSYRFVYTAGEYACIATARVTKATYLVAIKLFANGLIRKIAKAGVVAVVDELKQTLNMVAVDKSYHRIYKNKHDGQGE